MKYLTFLTAISFSFDLVGQDLKYGDSTIVESVRKVTSEIYETKGKTDFYLTSRLFQENVVSGTSIVAHSKNGTINRIVTSAFTDQGQLSAEWFYIDERILFSYLVFEFFAEKEPKGAWRNFKGLASWESRYYFDDDQLTYHQHKGRDMIVESTLERIQKDAEEILKYVKSQIRED